MAGNPFRRSVAVVPSPVNHFPDATTTPQQTRTKTKRVKIESPPHSFHRSIKGDGGGGTRGGGGGGRLSASDSATRAPSPLPPHDGDENDDDNDNDTAASNSTAPGDEDSNNLERRMKAPFNPFARTLATKEAAFGLQQDDSQHEGGRRQRPAMDVDAFKNLLLTGTANGTSSGSSGPSSPSPAAARGPHDDTPSAFDAAYTPHPESPRVDHYMYDFSSDGGDDDYDDYDNNKNKNKNDDDYDDDDDAATDNDDMHSNLMGQGRLDDLAPPAPPKPPIKRGPQTVSFADFDQSIPPNFQAPGRRGTPPLAPAQRGILRPTVQRSVSDLNKPLPPAPGGNDTAPLLPPAVPNKDVPRSPPEVTMVPRQGEEDLSTPARLAPPPPPASRRRAAVMGGRPRSASNLSTQESIADLPDPDPQSNLEESTHKHSQPPPPPPSRKVHSVAASSSTAAAAAAIDPPVGAPAETKPPIPPPPPRRHPSTSGSLRTASPASSLRRDVISNAAAPSPPPPPPPPPRRTAGGGGGGMGNSGSQRSSIDGRPSSLRGMENLQCRTAHERSSEGVGAEGKNEGDGKRDVLADMAAFEAEINALRVQASKGQ